MNGIVLPLQYYLYFGLILDNECQNVYHKIDLYFSVSLCSHTRVCWCCVVFDALGALLCALSVSWNTTRKPRQDEERKQTGIGTEKTEKISISKQH